MYNQVIEVTIWADFHFTKLSNISLKNFIKSKHNVLIIGYTY